MWIQRVRNKLQTTGNIQEQEIQIRLYHIKDSKVLESDSLDIWNRGNIRMVGRKSVEKELNADDPKKRIMFQVWSQCYSVAMYDLRWSTLIYGKLPDEFWGV